MARSVSFSSRMVEGAEDSRSPGGADGAVISQPNNMSKLSEIAPVIGGRASLVWTVLAQEPIRSLLDAQARQAMAERHANGSPNGSRQSRAKAKRLQRTVSAKSSSRSKPA